MSYTANALNQFSAVDVVTPTYDSNGNLTYDARYIYCYDAERHLIGTRISPITTIATYAYDAQARRKEKMVGSAAHAKLIKFAAKIAI